MTERRRLLIEDWLPLETLGAESMRERGASSALPPLYFLHVWWARRPLVTSRAAVLASLLPAWSEAFPSGLREQFPTRESYHAWFRRLCGIFGEPEKGRKHLQWAKANRKQIPNPYDSPRSFTVMPSPTLIQTLNHLLKHTWGTDLVSVLDPFAGGGSIPFEAMRYGLRTFANELNPVALTILKATLEYPARFGSTLGAKVKEYGTIWAGLVKDRLRPFYSDLPDTVPDAEGVAYLWARTVKCPYTGKPIPLAPNWWLRRGAEPVAVRGVYDPFSSEARFEIVSGEQCYQINPDLGTVRGGDGVSPWAGNQPVDGTYIKAEAQAGRMGLQLYALAIKRRGGFEFRAPTVHDAAVAVLAAKELERHLPEWEARGWVPDEPRSAGRADWAADVYGMARWRDTYAPRQLLAMLTMLEAYHEVAAIVRSDCTPGQAEAICTLLALAFDKAADYNSLQIMWHVSRQVIQHAFVRHDLAFKWNPAEFDASQNLVPWTINQVTDAYQGIARLVESTDLLPSAAKPAIITGGSAAELSHLPSGSLTAICTDPPYADNVMYSELSNYFYVWLKRLLGDQFPEWFRAELTDSESEAVTNVGRFRGFGKQAKKLAHDDYERKMAAAFREMHRVLRDDGVLTVMFTHKEVKAWDTLATALISAGFTIASSWPVHTESEHSLHQAKKNAAASTILLGCRKRRPGGETVWWDDLKGAVRRTARAKAREFQELGIRGVDLYISTFGPVLAIISEHWPVLTGEVDERTGRPKPLRPEVALDLAREEVVSLRRQGLLLGRSLQFDPITDWYLIAWDTFKAQEFPADEARKLSLALGLDLQQDLMTEKRIVTKKSDTVVLQTPDRRRKRQMVDPELDHFSAWIDAAHTAMLLYAEDGESPCQAFLRRTGLLSDDTFIACIQALLNAIPRTRERGEFVRPEASVLENMRLSFWPDLGTPTEEEPPEPMLTQARLSLEAMEGANSEEEDEEE